MPKFSYTIDSSKLSRGLRPSKRMPRNSGFLSECAGAIGRDGVLQVLDEITRLTTTTITDPHPYPQIFVFTSMIIVCSATKIYEWVDGALVEKLIVDSGSTWTAVDFFNYAYLSNTQVAVIRSAATGEYSITTELPTNMAVCDFNGQVIIGAPDVPWPSINKTAEAVEVTLSMHGEWV